MAIDGAEITATSKAPVVELLRRQWRTVLLGAGSFMMWLSLFYIGSVYLINYGTSTLGISRNVMLLISIAAIVSNIAGQLAGARITDSFGRAPSSAEPVRSVSCGCSRSSHWPTRETRG